MRIVKNEPQLQTKAQRLTIKWYKTVIKTYDVVCIFFYAQWCPGNGRGNYESEYDKAANIIANLYSRERHCKGKAIMLKVNCDDEKVLAAMFNVWCYPIYKIIKNGEIMEPTHPSWRNTENFLQFIEEFIDDKKPRLPVPDLSIMRFGFNTAEITSENYKSFVKENDIVFVLFYAFWYQSCRHALEVYEQAYLEISKLYHTKYSLKKPPEVEFVRMEAGLDGTAIKKFGIRKYPTFKLFKNGVMWREYHWDGTLEGIVDFIKTQMEKKKQEKLKYLKSKHVRSESN